MVDAEITRVSAGSANCLEWNLKWGPQERGTATVRDWQADQNLLQP